MFICFRGLEGSIFFTKRLVHGSTLPFLAMCLHWNLGLDSTDYYAVVQG